MLLQTPQLELVYNLACKKPPNYYTKSNPSFTNKDFILIVECVDEFRNKFLSMT